MTYFIILLATIMVLGPILWILPNHAQRQLAVLRRTAMTLGLQIRINRLQDPRPVAKKMTKPAFVEGVSYFLPWARFQGMQALTLSTWQVCRIHHGIWAQLDDHYGVDVPKEPVKQVSPFHFGTPLNDDWSFTIEPHPVMNEKQASIIARCLDQLPNDVYMVESTRQHLIIFWQEHATVEDIRQLYQALDKGQKEYVQQLQLEQQLQADHEAV